ncbi:MAG: amidohydrolase [Chloroflexi bacterium]|nr:amidohydrolase [Chloroflexota bacterium]MCL5074306.1 amidohydrolase [Chloroflexota bacterium]
MIFEKATVITVDAQRRIILDGAVAIQGDRIVGVGKTEEMRKQFPAEERIEATGKLIMPGLINTHVHLAQAMLRCCADDLPQLQRLGQRILVLQGNYTVEDGRASAALCLLEMLRSGTTAFVESMIASRYGFDGIAEVVRASGMRAVLSKTVMDRPSPGRAAALNIMYNIMHSGLEEDRQASLAEALAMHDKWDGVGGGRIKVWFGPRPLGGCTPGLYQEISKIAAKRGLGITVHLAEVKTNVEYTKSEFGLLPVEFAESVGLLGPNCLLAHAVWLTEAEIVTLARMGTHVVHCPSSNMKGGHGFAPIPAMLQQGVNVGLGTDGGHCNNTYDLVREMKLAAVIHNGITLDPTVMPAEQVVEMATINGAKAMGLDSEIGSLEVGKKADLVIIDMDKPHLTPCPNPVSGLVYSACGGDVDTVLIDGKVVVKDGHVLTLDEEEVLAEARRRAQALLARTGVQPCSRWPTL